MRSVSERRKHARSKDPAGRVSRHAQQRVDARVRDVMARRDAATAQRRHSSCRSARPRAALGHSSAHDTRRIAFSSLPSALPPAARGDDVMRRSPDAALDAAHVTRSRERVSDPNQKDPGASAFLAWADAAARRASPTPTVCGGRGGGIRSAQNGAWRTNLATVDANAGVKDADRGPPDAVGIATAHIATEDGTRTAK
jgi:hypothetical protein